jgi:threonine/homoserine/homoserine lactone efflux protein
MPTLILRGFVLGLAIAAPVGPIGVLCIRRTLAQGRAIGFVSGLGAATADVIYGCIAAFGLTAISGLLVRHQAWLSLVGGLFLCYLGVRTLLSRPAGQSAAAEGHGFLGAYFSTFLLTLTNPMTILSFVAVFAGLGVGHAGVGSAGNGYAAAAAIVFGVFLGSSAWWFLLSGGVSLVRDRFDARAMLWVNRVSGVIILGFGAAAMGSLLR